jgi:hypothetical protein
VSADITPLIRGYLTRAGWAESAPGPAGAMWRRDVMESGVPMAVIGVPDRVRYGSFEWRGIIGRLAEHERRTATEVTADIIGRAGDDPLTCECCRSAPATHLLVADFPKSSRATRLACEPCGRTNLRYGGKQPPTLVRLYLITEVPDGN